VLLVYVLAWVSLAGAAKAHEMTPTYLQLKNSFVDNVATTRVELLNRREDVSYFALSVYDSAWNPIAFATKNRLVKVDYLNRQSIDIYIKNSDRDRATYVCSVSKLKKEDVKSTAISSKICSKIK
jgi:hypothetical protein